MRGYRGAVALYAALFVIPICLLIATGTGPGSTTPRASAAARCAEDMPCWDWSRMGNRKRGVVTMWGTPKTVTCGDLRWLVRHGDLDPHTPRLLGDKRCGRR